MGISIWQLLIVLVIVLLLFGTKKLRNLGADLGGAVKGFKGAMKDGTDESKEAESEGESGRLEREGGTVVEGEVNDKERDRA